MAIEVKPFFRDQQQVMFDGARVAYCGTKPNMPLNMLSNSSVSLTPEEWAEVVAAVEQAVGKVRLPRYFQKQMETIESERNSFEST